MAQGDHGHGNESGGGKGGVKSDINVTPLVDVMLVLLIIMMIIAPMLQKGIDVKLPTASNTVDKPETQDQTVVAVNAAGQLYLDQVEVPEADLARRVSEKLESKKAKIVLIKADEDAPYGARDGGHGHAAQGTGRGHGPGHRAQDQARADGRQLMKHAHKHFGAEDVIVGEKPHVTRGHERHAAHRRAARAAGHLHGGPAADAEGPGHQPAGRKPRRRKTRRRTSARSSSSSRADQPHLGQQAGRRRLAELEKKLRTIFEQRKDKTMFIAGAPSLRYGEIVAVIDAAKGAGVEKVGIVTEGMKKEAAGTKSDS